MTDLTAVEQQAIKPYGSGPMASSGYSGGATSEERVRRDDADGTTGKRQARVLALLGEWEFDGMTVKELRTETGWHHGQASAALSNLHKAGLICRTEERRSRCFIYVLPEHLGGRAHQPHGGGRKGRSLSDLEERQLAGASEAVEKLGMGLPMWRAKQLIDIINRLTS